MTPYPLLSLVFTAVAVIVLLFAVAVRARRGQRIGRWLALIACTAVVLVLLTAVFDNIMISAGLMRYGTDRISGVMVGVVPIEDFTYALAAALLLPSLWTLLPAGRRG